MEIKRIVSVLIPYKFHDGRVLVYLQKRDKGIERHPDCFGFFGGGAEGSEKAEEALKREIKEELDFIIEGEKNFGIYESDNAIKTVFTFKVPDDFEEKITVLEGEYGKWFNKNEAMSEPKLIESDKLVLENFFEFLKK